MKTIAVVNLKGGSSKTTTTAFLAHAIAAAGRDVLVIDSDPQGSTVRWSDAAAWDIPTVALPVKNLHTRVRGIARPTTDVVVIDTPPLLENAGTVYSALRAADVVIVPCAPTSHEVDALPDVWAAIEEVQALRHEPAAAAVLLTRTIPNASSTGVYRESIEDSGHHVLTTVIPRREAYAQALGAPVRELGAYEPAAAEVLALEVQA
ncbi:ParA family protein (plasmid) [Brachybacterium huguangmaarense]|uniref:ParA family protein n=1 Tax=Brachybacterium huguangmaarense TaxID=1652028 RepID=A0ABY6G6T6_9MICO|nr:ParA family protein [Brachybacterium huguangmaarense]UYG18319.1 ParA family protein [Brachybacterium huguangmaarense]